MKVLPQGAVQGSFQADRGGGVRCARLPVLRVRLPCTLDFGIFLMGGAGSLFNLMACFVYKFSILCGSNYPSGSGNTLSWEQIPKGGEGHGRGFWSLVRPPGEAASHLCASVSSSSARLIFHFMKLILPRRVVEIRLWRQFLGEGPARSKCSVSLQ